MERNSYVDLQVNGYVGVDFNDPCITPEQIHAVSERLSGEGVRILATVITAPPERMIACLRNLVKAREQDALTREVICGFHVEGPFISGEEGYSGAHPRAETCQADCGRASHLIEAGGGLVRIFTLAPERDPGGRVTRLLADQKVRVAAGHTNASLDQLSTCADNGLDLFTHLGNGCPMYLHRHDNIIQRALSLRRCLHYGLIADGAHVPPVALRNYIDLIGLDRCFIVTDAISAAGLGPGRYKLGDQTVEVDETQVVWSADHSHFVGSAATMRRCADVLKQAGFHADEIQKLTRCNAEKLLKNGSA